MVYEKGEAFADIAKDINKHPLLQQEIRRPITAHVS